MDKEIIIDGVDVSECGFLHPVYGDKDCHIALAFTDEYGECTKCEQNPNCYYKQLIRKEQELQELKALLKDKYIKNPKVKDDDIIVQCDKKENCIFYLDRNIVFKNNKKLQAENEKLKERVKNFEDELNTYGATGVCEVCTDKAVKGNDKLCAENKKLKQAIDEVIEIARMRYAGSVPSVVANGAYELNMNKILSIIKQADLRRVEPTEGSEPDNVRAIVDGNEVRSTACPRESKSKTAKGEE